VNREGASCVISCAVSTVHVMLMLQLSHPVHVMLMLQLSHLDAGDF
jgi:hypothetical protein